MKVDILATLLSEAQAQNVATLTQDQQDLAQQMIEDSNDDDAQDLWDFEGGSSGQRVRRQGGHDQHRAQRRGLLGPVHHDGGGPGHAVAQGGVPQQPARRHLAQLRAQPHDQRQPSQAWGISSGPTAGVMVAIKNGWLPNDNGIWQVNSIGWVSGAGRDYVIAVLTDGDPTEEDGIDDRGALRPHLGRPGAQRRPGPDLTGPPAGVRTGVRSPATARHEEMLRRRGMYIRR